MVREDGSNVNWLNFEKLNRNREMLHHTQLFGIKNCELRSIHDTFETGLPANGKLVKLRSQCLRFLGSFLSIYLFFSINKVITFLKRFVSFFLYLLVWKIWLPVSSRKCTYLKFYFQPNSIKFKIFFFSQKNIFSFHCCFLGKYIHQTQISFFRQLLPHKLGRG